MTIKELRSSTGMSQTQFAEYFEIPVRTLQEWEQERKSPAPYFINLLERIIKMNNLGAIKKLYSIINSQDVLFDIEHDVLTENVCRNGRKVIWYKSDGEEEAIYTDTLEFLTEEEIESELC